MTWNSFRSSLSGTTFDIDVPFTYNLPDTATGLVFTGRRMEDDHAAVFEMAEDLLNKFVYTDSKLVHQIYGYGQYLLILKSTWTILILDM